MLIQKDKISNNLRGFINFKYINKYINKNIINIFLEIIYRLLDCPNILLNFILIETNILLKLLVVYKYNERMFSICFYIKK